MFKSKKWLFLLIPTTLFIWSIIGYQVYDGLNPELPVVENDVQFRFRESGKKIELINLNLPEYDPFLGTAYVKKSSKQPANKTAPIKRKVLWPEITYKGIVKNKGSSKKVVAVEINGATKLMSLQKMVDSITLIKATNTFIQLKYKNESRRFESK
ncbi:hypothetical protein [Nonlabens ulvanivorans]|uniref:hypothetical protein n=1 Tax=Nonlabens ulvanivorans TaxID=906888 RepID=UPI0037CB6827